MTLVERMDDQDTAEFLETLLRLGHLEPPADGVTRQVLGQGIDSLSDRQRYVFEQDVIEVYGVEECSMCANEVPWSEMYEAYDSGGMCARCLHHLSKD